MLYLFVESFSCRLSTYISCYITNQRIGKKLNFIKTSMLMGALDLNGLGREGGIVLNEMRLISEARESLAINLEE